jgi:hypothetical protein
MHQPPTLRLSTWARLVGLALLLVVGVLASLGLASRTAHAQPAATLSVTDCSGEFGPGRIGTVISSASAGDRITFSCSGTIPITSTLTISTNNLTLDGSGQAVTLDGGNSMEVLSVNSGVTFTLNALTIANGAGADCGELCSLAGGLENGGTVSISNSTFANNSTLIGGGGLQNFGGTVSISNSTFANNSAGFGGGGLDNEFGTVSISNSTFANNLTFNSGGGGLSNCCGGGTMSISNSIVANNSGGNCASTITDQGYNLESGSDCGFTGTGDLQNTDPKLASALASNGGPTQTLALLDGSPAINHLPTSACPVATDQRGVSRPQGPACDIGAFEFRVPTLSLPGTITTDATSPQGATVSYTATASEPDDASATPTLSCTPASGSTFAIGTTTVNCSASDAASPPDVTTGSFQVVVQGAAAQVSDLISLVNSFGLPADFQASFDTQLQAVQTDLTNSNTTQACRDLTAFLNHVQAQSGKGLTVSQATQLLAAAKQIQAVLGC